MEKESNKLISFIAVTGLVFASLWLVVGCGTSENPISASEAAEEGALVPAYPALTEAELIRGPAPGYQFFSRDLARTLDDPPACDSVLAQRLCRPQNAQTITLDQIVQLVVTQGDVQQNVVLSAVAPNGCIEVVDFYPHPYQFNGPVEIHWLIHSLDLPDDFDYDSLVPFYINDAGEYELMPHEWTEQHRELIVYTDHFSRYVLGMRSN